MRIFITGATGLLGRRLVVDRLERGDHLVIVSRDADRARQMFAAHVNPNIAVVQGNPATPGEWMQQVDGCDAVIHLAGAGLADRRWNDSYKKLIVDSRIDSTYQVGTAIREAQRPPSVLISGSATGYYGDCGDSIVSESHPAGGDFLAEVCVRWEEQARQVSDVLRIVTIRTSMVLDQRGGALPKLIGPFKWFVGGPLGIKPFWMPWIHWRDWTGLIQHVLTHGRMKGPVNACSPNPVTNWQLARAIGRILHRPWFAPVPALALRMVVGEMGKFITASQRVVPRQAELHDFGFLYPQIDEALHALLSASEAPLRSLPMVQSSSAQEVVGAAGQREADGSARSLLDGHAGDTARRSSGDSLSSDDAASGSGDGPTERDRAGGSASSPSASAATSIVTGATSTAAAGHADAPIPILDLGDDASDASSVIAPSREADVALQTAPLPPPTRHMPTMPIKLLAIDVDGTLLGSDNRLSPGVIQACRAAVRAGCVIVLATARPPRGTRKIMQALNFQSPTINFHGALIWNHQAERAQYHEPMSAELVGRIIERAREVSPTVQVGIEVLDRWFTDRIDPRFQREVGPVADPDGLGPLDSFLDQPVTRLSFFGLEDELPQIVPPLQQEFWQTRQVSMVMTGPRWVQVLHPLVDKGIALQRIARKLNVTRDEVMAIGDHINDAGMIGWSGFGVAVSNALDSIKQLADAVVPSNDDLGVARAIHRYILSNR